ncbi:hypothetical protein ACVGXP_11315, partial [Enterobacter hormaechei]
PPPPPPPPPPSFSTTRRNTPSTSASRGLVYVFKRQAYDIADCFVYVLQPPEHVDVEELFIMPTEQPC